VTIKPPKGKKPYAGTSVPIERSKGQITELLREYGAEGVAWTDNFQTGAVQLRFAVRRDDGRTTGYQITPAAFKEKHSSWDATRGRTVTVEAPNWPRAMRLLHAWLKTKLESIAFGLTEVEEEFMAQMLVQDQYGHETTVGELVLPAVEAGGGRLQLEAPKKHEGAIDTEAHGA
jgi:hypothetical protein